MPLFAAAGIPWFASLVGGLFATLVGFFAKFVTMRVAVMAAGVAIIITLTAGLFTALEGLMAGISYTIPAEIAGGVALVSPSNLTACTTIIISAHLLKYVYSWNVRIVQHKFKW